jgi:hypothetical protein
MKRSFDDMSEAKEELEKFLFRHDLTEDSSAFVGISSMRVWNSSGRSQLRLIRSSTATVY